MKLLVSGCSATAGEWIDRRPDRVGVLMTPGNGNAVPTGVTWAADNECFRGLNPARWLRFLAKVIEAGGRPAWVACPDVVADMAATWALYRVWSPVLRSLGLPVALVLQDGVALPDVAAVWDDVAAVFVGGTTPFKLGPVAARIVREAKARRTWVHAGRVNTKKRIEHFARLGADSFDGSGFSKWGKRIRLAVDWIDAAVCRPVNLIDAHD